VTHKYNNNTMQFIEADEIDVDDNGNDDMTYQYIISPKLSKSFREVAHYIKVLSTGRAAKIIYTTLWQDGSCMVELNNTEKEEVLSSKSICVNDYSCEFCESTDGCYTCAELEDEETYSDIEMKEILESACEMPDNDEDGFTMDECSPEIMEDIGGWSLDDTYYYIDNGCELVQEEDTL
jgi:hypothetical protein